MISRPRPPTAGTSGHHLPASSRRDAPVPGYHHQLRTADAWSAGRCATTCIRPLVIAALQQAAVTRGRLKGVVFHTDHGSVYTSKAFATECKKLGVTQSMGAVGSSADNALAESFNATLKREVVKPRVLWRLVYLMPVVAGCDCCRRW